MEQKQEVWVFSSLSHAALPLCPRLRGVELHFTGFQPHAATRTRWYNYYHWYVRKLFGRRAFNAIPNIEPSFDWKTWTLLGCQFDLLTSFPVEQVLCRLLICPSAASSLDVEVVGNTKTWPTSAPPRQQTFITATCMWTAQSFRWWKHSYSLTVSFSDLLKIPLYKYYSLKFHFQRNVHFYWPICLSTCCLD